MAYQVKNLYNVWFLVIIIFALEACSDASQTDLKSSPAASFQTTNTVSTPNIISSPSLAPATAVKTVNASSTPLAATPALSSTSLPSATPASSATTASAPFTASTPAVVNIDPQKVAAGQKVFAAQCSGCHLENGKAAGGIGPNLSISQNALNPDYIRNNVRHGKGQMVAFEQTEVSDTDLENIIQYLRSIHQ